MIIAQPRECPGIQVRRATKRLYIGSYTIVERAERSDPGWVTLYVMIRSPLGVFRETTYFQACAENTLYKASKDIGITAHDSTIIGVQKLFAVSLIPTSGSESIEIDTSSHGLIVIDPVVVLCTDTFGIFGTTRLSDSIDKNTSCFTGVVFGWGKNQYWIRSEPRKAIAKRLRSLSLSINYN